MKRVRSKSGLTWCDMPGPNGTGEGLIAVAGRLQRVTVTHDRYAKWQPDCVVHVDGKPVEAFVGNTSRCQTDGCELYAAGMLSRINEGKVSRSRTACVIRTEAVAIDPDYADMPWPVLRDWLLDRDREDLVAAGDIHYRFDQIPVEA